MKDKLDSCSERVGHIPCQVDPEIYVGYIFHEGPGYTFCKGCIHVPTHVGHKMEVKNLKNWLNGKPRVLPNP